MNASSGSAPYRFPTALDDGMLYRARVKTQPGGPEQVCFFVDENGLPRAQPVEGRILGAGATDLDIQCFPSASLVLTVPGQGRALPVKALIVRDEDGEIIGKTCDGAMLPAGGGEVRIVPAEGDECRRPEEAVPAALAAGPHTVHVWVDSDNWEPGRRPVYQPGDMAFQATVPVAGIGPVPVRAGPLVASVAEPVTIRGSGIPPGASARCYWTAPTGERPAVPVAEPFGRSTLECPPGGPACFEAAGGVMRAITRHHDPLAPGTYDLTCWVDLGGAGGTPNGVLDGPDRVGFRAGVVVDGPGMVGAQAVVEVGEP